MNRMYVSIIAVATLLAGPLAAQTNESKPHLSVSGEGIVNVTATHAQIQLGVHSEGKTANAAQAETARKANAVVNMLRGEKASQIETVRIALQPRYEHKKSSGETEIIGYVSTNVLAFRIEIGRAGELLDKSVKAGANRIESVQLTADDKILKEAREQALAAAAVDARAQAKIVLDALDLKMKRIVQINAGVAFPGPQPYAINQMREGAGTPVVGGDLEVRANVSMVVEY